MVFLLAPATMKMLGSTSFTAPHERRIHTHRFLVLMLEYFHITSLATVATPDIVHGTQICVLLASAHLPSWI
jgi:hypothetical protein